MATHKEIHLDEIIDADDLIGLQAQDGWETTELTVKDKYAWNADAILARLRERIK